MRVIHTVEELCEGYFVKGYFKNQVSGNIGIPQWGRVLWHGYSPVDGFVLIAESQSSEEAPYTKLGKSLES